MSLDAEQRRNFQDALELFDSRVRATPGTAWASPSPCEGWTARDVLAHLVTNLRALREAASGGDFFATFGQPVEGDAVEAWAQERDRALASLDAAEAGGLTSVTVRGNAVPLGAIVDGLMRDLVIHTWDLARAVGGDERLPDDLVAAATVAMSMVGEQSRGPGLYGYEVPAPPGADAQTRLLALSGRKA